MTTKNNTLVNRLLFTHIASPSLSNLLYIPIINQIGGEILEKKKLFFLQDTFLSLTNQ